MAGSGKSVAILATLMFAMLLSGSMVNAARPIGVDGAEAAAVQPHSRQLNFFFHKFFFAHHCGWWNYWSCHPRYTVTPTPAPAPEEEEEDDKRRKLQSVNGGDAIQANGRQLNFFLFRKKCGYFWWSKCGDDKKGDIKYDSHSRKLRFFGILAFKKCLIFGCYKPVKVDYYEPEPKKYYGKH